MLYHGNLILLILLLISQVTEGSGYNCSDFDQKHPLVECPPAKFMLKDNLVECFDNYTKNSYSKYPLSFFIDTKLYFSTFLYCVELTGFVFAILNCTLCCNKIQNLCLTVYFLLHLRTFNSVYWFKSAYNKTVKNFTYF